jgi:hypothetical protein
MIHYFSSLLTGLFSIAFGVSSGQEPGPKPVVFTTPPQRIELRRPDDPQTYHGQASLTLLEAGSDDTIRAQLVVTLTSEERQRLGQPGLELPETIGRQELRLRWHKGTSCPDIDLDLPTVRLAVSQAVSQAVNGRQLETRPTRVRIDVSLRTVETLPQLLCSWTRQINAGRPRQGIIMAINRLLLPAEPN